MTNQQPKRKKNEIASKNQRKVFLIVGSGKILICQKVPGGWLFRSLNICTVKSTEMNQGIYLEQESEQGQSKNLNKSWKKLFHRNCTGCFAVGCILNGIYNFCIQYTWLLLCSDNDCWCLPYCYDFVHGSTIPKSLWAGWKWWSRKTWASFSQPPTPPVALLAQEWREFFAGWSKVCS